MFYRECEDSSWRSLAHPFRRQLAKKISWSNVTLNFIAECLKISEISYTVCDIALVVQLKHRIMPNLVYWICQDADHIISVSHSCGINSCV